MRTRWYHAYAHRDQQGLYIVHKDALKQNSQYKAFFLFQSVVAIVGSSRDLDASSILSVCVL